MDIIFNGRRVSFMSYILRRVIFEDRWEAQLAELLELCPHAGITGVLLLEQSHQMLMVPFPIEKHERMANIYARMAGSLRSAGISFGVNIASIVGHSDADVPDSLVLPFQRFVGDNLRPACACYCILDSQWQKYAATVCEIYAQSCQPDTLFIDDDFRSINHTTTLGCFCDLHLARTSAIVHRALTQQGLRDHVLGTSPADLAVRCAWMRINYDGQRDAASAIQRAVERVSPRTRVGLMNSGEPSHAVQGRDMDELLRSFAGSMHRPISRPLGGCYHDAVHEGFAIAHQGMALSMSVLGDDVEIVSEVENWPHTRFNKSLAVTRVQLEMHALAGADAFTLNLYDYLATPFHHEPGIAAMLREQAERLVTIQNARRDKQPEGFALPWRHDCVKYLRPYRSDPAHLIPARQLDLLLPRFGIPTQFTLGHANAVVGDEIEAYCDDECEGLLSGGLLIDSVAHQHLTRRGFEQALGCHQEGIWQHAAVERVEGEEFGAMFCGHLMPTCWFKSHAQRHCTARLHPAPSARTVTTLLDLDMRELGPGMVLFENDRGGRVAVLAAPIEKRSWFYRARAALVSRVARWLSRDRLPVWIDDCPDIQPYFYRCPESGDGLLGLVNATLDNATPALQTRGQLYDLFTGAHCAAIPVLAPLQTAFFRVIGSGGLS